MKTVHTYCSLCGVGCPSVITVDGSRVVSLDADKTHPLGGITCPKGRAAPEIHDHPHRVNHPLRRTRPKTDVDPGWERCSWDEALDLVASKLDQIRRESGPHAVAFNKGTGSGTGMLPTEPWINRLTRAFGSPNYMTNTHVCNWARDGASYYTFGVYPLPVPDVQRSNCIILWGANPSATLINLAQSVSAARARGARLIVVDPRRTGLATKADLLLQLRPGTDGALAWAFINVLVDNHWFDEAFVRHWTNAPLLVRDDTGRLLRRDEVATPTLLRHGSPDRSGEPGYVGAARTTDRLVEYQPSRGYAIPTGDLGVSGSIDVDVMGGGRVRCRPVFDLLVEEAARYPPPVAAQVTGVPEQQIIDAVRLIVENRPVSHHVWNGIVQHTNATQTGRAIEIFYALIGDWDRPGGNVVRPDPITAPIGEGVRLSDEQAGRRLGLDDRPLGPPAVSGNIAAFDLYASVLDARPYRLRALLSFGSNTLLNSADPLRGREAFQRVEFFAQAELFHTPTNQYADVLLPATTFLESEIFVVTRAGRAERRPRTIAPLYERRHDVEIVFDLACRLGLGDWFAGGDLAAAYDEVLAPAGLSWQGLLDHPEGVDVTPPVQYDKHTQVDTDGSPRGFRTPTGKIELFVDRFAAGGHSPLAAYEEPAQSPYRTPALATEFPLVLTNAKRPRYLQSQHRGVESLRRRSPDPTIEIHPETASRFDIVNGSWVMIETPVARVRAKADVTTAIVPGTVCANHGWWEACEELRSEGLDPFSERGANINLLVHNDVRDPIGGGIPHRSALCRLRPLPERSP